MKGLIYDAYGFYPSTIENNQFVYNQQYYFIFFTDKNEEQIYDIAQLSLEILEHFPNKAGLIVLNKKGKYTTEHLGKRMLLVNLNPVEIEVEDFMKFHYLFDDIFKFGNIKCEDLLAIWHERYQFCESEIVPAIRADFAEYNLVLETIFYGFGLAENALQYLADIKIDLNDPSINTTITHLRLPNFDYFNFFNPLNYYIDNICRDVAELYKNNLIDLRNLEIIIDSDGFSQLEASLLMARVLYPSYIFDLLEDFYIQKIDIRRKIIEYNYNLKIELSKIKNLHILLVNKFNIRPIKWLLD